tara:strand:+ start:873 stop:1037 length:165 start_codon:yes stop_codon:yes gene_type:complete
MIGILMDYEQSQDNFLCDASVKSGMRHFTRSLAIAESLKEFGEKIYYFYLKKNL